MRAISHDGVEIDIRADLTDAHRRAWERLARPGTWFTGAERVALAAETRAAPDCSLCRERKAALTPYVVKGEHHASDALPAALIEVAHRIRTDPGRLKRSWFEDILAAGVGRNRYVEALGVVVTVVAVDTFHRGIGGEPPALPEPLPGAPSRYEPEGLDYDRACQRRSKNPPLGRRKNTPRAAGELVHVVHGRAPRAGRRAPQPG